MLLHSQTELEAQGRPGSRDLLWATLATILVITQASVFIYRMIKSLEGSPLPLLFFDDVRIVDPWWQYTGGFALYVAGLVGCVLILWASLLQFQRWLFWKRRPH